MKKVSFTKWIASACIVLSSLAIAAEIVPDKTSVSILTPSFAERKTSKMLLNNGLEVYLISDPYAKQSGAALSVHVGSWNDPKDYPGMAHFLEHMLFMGTKAYPDENEYSMYLQNNGGLYNAYTAPDRTVYMLAVDHNAFAGAVDRFSHFFIDPLFSRSSISRELNAVDQEHAKNVEDDGSRVYQVFKETSNPNHPNSMFSTGNAKTLSGIPQEAMLDWYKKYYSANRMHLVMISTDSIETMQKLAEEHFSQVPVSPYLIKPITASVLSNRQKGAIIYIKPIKDIKVLSLIWEIPSSYTLDNNTQIPRLAAYVLGNEGPGGLSYDLKNEGLAENVRMGADRYSSNEAFFCIDIDLTEEGLAEKEKILEKCYSMIHLLQKEGIPESYFKELHQLSVIDYEYQSRENIFSQMMQYAGDMVYEPLNTFPTAGLIPEKYDAAGIAKFLKTLTPESCLTYVLADPEITHIPLTNTEKWVGAEYTVKPIAADFLKYLASIPPSEDYKLPAPNPYIPTNFTLVKSEATENGVPTLLVNDPFCKLYHLVDTHYQEPQSVIAFGIESVSLDGSAKTAAMLSLYLRALSDALSVDTDTAGSAGLDAQIQKVNTELRYTISGFSDKALTLTEAILNHIAKPPLTEKQFEQYKQYYLAEFDNASKELPIRQAQELLGSVLLNDAPLCEARMKALQEMEFADYEAFIENLFKSTHVNALIYGNTSSEDAMKFYAKLQSVLPSEANSETTLPKQEVLVLNKTEGPFRLTKETSMQGNGVLLCLQQGPLDLKTRTSQSILTPALHEAFFDDLRTKQQTGYIVKAYDSEVERQLLTTFIAQSNSHTCDELLARFELFLENFVKGYSDQLTEERFENLRSSLINNLTKPPENLFVMANRFYALAFDYDGDFDWINKRLKAAKEITYDEVKNFAMASFSRKNLSRIAITVNGVLPEESVFSYITLTPDELKEKGTYESAE